MRQSGDNKILRDFIDSAEKRSIPKIIEATESRIADEYSEFEKIARGTASPSIYGYNKLPGHRDHEDFPEDYFDRFQEQLVKNHAIDLISSDATTPEDYITLAKLYAFAAGGSLVSPELFAHLRKAFEGEGPKSQLGLGNSYSSGDVIPAAIWASRILSHGSGYKLKPGEGMALINGSFVHVGSAVWALKRLDQVFAKFLLGTQHFFKYVSADDAFYEYPHTSERRMTSSAIRFVSEFGFPPRVDQPQAPVSVRATPQILDGLITAIQDVAFEINYFIFKPSGNPQLRKGPNGEFHVVPSGSFVVPSLSLAQGKLADALLMVIAYIQRRLEFFLSGKVMGIPRDGARDGDPLGLIQWPKLIAARIERARLRYSRRVFGSIAITSYGIEDFSSNGSLLSEDLIRLASIFLEIVELDFAAMTAASSDHVADLGRARAKLSSQSITLSPELSFTR